MRIKHKLACTVGLLALGSVAWAQGNSEEGRLRALNAQTLRLQGLLRAASAPGQANIRSQAAGVLATRQAVLEGLMASDPAAALRSSFPSDVLAGLAESFPLSAGSLEQRGTFQGELNYFVEDGENLAWHRERRQVTINGQPVEWYPAEPNPAGSECSDVISASGVLTGGSMVSESSEVVAAAATCSTTGAQNIAVILVNMASQNVRADVDQDFLNGVFLGNAFTSDTHSPDWSLSDFWTQNSDGQTWINSSGTGALTIVSVNVADFAYCSGGSDNSGAMRQAAYAAADGVLNYQDFTRVALVVPNNGTCTGIAGVASIGCWSSECPGDGACTRSWTWLRDDQIASRSNGVRLTSHEMGHNQGVSHSGSRDHNTEVVGPIGVAGTRTEYGDVFSTMGSWNFGFYNAPHLLNRLGWLTSANVQTVTSTGTYTIQNYDARPAGLKSLKVARGTGTTNAWFYISYYPNSGIYLSQLGSQIYSGAIIQYDDSQTPSGKTDLLDFTPETSSWNDPALAVGQSWQDPYSDLTLTVNSKTDTSLTVSVTYGTGVCTEADPTVTFTGNTNQSAVQEEQANFTVQVTNHDSPSCSMRSFNMSSASPSGSGGWASSFSQTSLSLAPGASGTTTLSLTPSTGVISNTTYDVDATATAGSNSGTATNASVLVLAQVFDLSLGTLSGPTEVGVGVDADIALPVTNTGNQMMSSYTVTLSDGGPYSENLPVPSLGAGQSATLHFTFSSGTTGTYSLAGSLDGSDDNAGNDAAGPFDISVAELPPAAPSNVTVDQVTEGKGKNKTVVAADLVWTDNSSDETGFEIEECVTTGSKKNQTTTCSPLASVGENVTTYTLDINSLADSYQVRAVKGTTLASDWVNTNGGSGDGGGSTGGGGGGHGHGKP